jgi:hypothetical protein
MIMQGKTYWGIGWGIAFLGFPPAGALALLLIGRLDSPLEGLLGGAVAGVVIGAAQMIALRRRIPISSLWIVATAVGLAVGLALTVIFFGAATTLDATLIRALPTGFILGAAQWIVLRRYIARAYAWIGAATLIYPLAWFITAQVIGNSLNEGFVVFGASGALVFQMLMGLVLWGLLRRSVQSS